MSASKRFSVTLSPSDYSMFSEYAVANRLSVASTVVMFAIKGIGLHQAGAATPPLTRIATNSVDSNDSLAVEDVDAMFDEDGNFIER